MYGSNSTQINTILDEHTYGRTWANKNTKSPLLTDLYMDRIKLNPTWSVDSFLAIVKSEWNHGCTKRKAYMALDKALKIIEGKHAEQYTKLWDFAEEVKKTNPGSTVKVKLDRGRFQRIYVCLGACKKGFKSGCRPLIGLDGCHLKSVYGGQLLCVVGIDPNDETWVIAYAVVEMENKSSWIWFLELLAVDVGIVNQRGWTFISDQQKGLIPTFKKVLPNSHHIFCMRHLHTDFRNLFKGKTLKDALWSVARTTTVPYFKKAMENLKKLDEKLYDWLVKLPAHHWSKSHFETHLKCDMLLNNLCDSFNAVILIPRQQPIITMLLFIHTLLMKRIQMRRDIMANKVGDLCPKIKKKLEEAKIESGRCIAQWSGGSKFQVDAGGGEQYVVDLVEKTRFCRKYALTGIPCNHAISAINFKKEKPEDYVNAYYSKARYLELYSYLVMPMSEMSM
ncbi:uncharacterized protein [Pyrus communis]|uniref:uncharacterized protein n=1 Tax=Pyrus communis TaxID=23211 RepID=UPI0035C046F9